MNRDWRTRRIALEGGSELELRVKECFEQSAIIHRDAIENAAVDVVSLEMETLLNDLVRETLKRYPSGAIFELAVDRVDFPGQSAVALNLYVLSGRIATHPKTPDPSERHKGAV